MKRIAVDYPILVRDEVAKKLVVVAEKLPGNLLLQVDSGYRSIETQKIVWQFRYDENRRKFTDLPEDKIYEITRKLVFDPASGTPPHSTGGAIDVCLKYLNGGEVNLAAPFTKYYAEPQLISDKITKEAQELRLLLNKLMLEQGFAPNPREHWHFSYGDKDWANHYMKPQIYNAINVKDVTLFPLYERIWYRAVRKLWRTLNQYLRFQTNY